MTGEIEARAQIINYICHCEAPQGPWQSLGSIVQPKFPVRCCLEIAASASPPRNDMGKSKPGRRPSTTSVIARPHRGRGNLWEVSFIRHFPSVAALRLPRRLRLLAMTRGEGTTVYRCHCEAPQGPWQSVPRVGSSTPQRSHKYARRRNSKGRVHVFAGANTCTLPFVSFSCLFLFGP